MKFIAIVAIAIASTIAGSEGLKCHKCSGTWDCEEPGKKVDCPRWAMLCGKGYEGEVADEKKVNFRDCVSAVRNVFTKETKFGVIQREGRVAELEESGIRLLKSRELRRFMNGSGSQKCVRDAKNIETCACDSDFCNFKGDPPTPATSTRLRCHSCEDRSECEKLGNETTTEVCPRWAHACGMKISYRGDGSAIVWERGCWIVMKEGTNDEPRFLSLNNEDAVRDLSNKNLHVFTKEKVKSYMHGSGSQKCVPIGPYERCVCGSDLCNAPGPMDHVPMDHVRSEACSEATTTVTPSTSTELRCHSCYGQSECEKLGDETTPEVCPKGANACGIKISYRGDGSATVWERGCWAVMKHETTNVTRLEPIASEPYVGPQFTDEGYDVLTKDEVKAYMHGSGCQKCVPGDPFTMCVCKSDLCKAPGPMDQPAPRPPLP